jgi:uncharacterized repeat protein (TIGR01451 family)
MANSLGSLPGGPATAAENHAVTAYTSLGSEPADAIMLKTNSTIPLTGGNRFITFSIDTVETACSSARAQLKFYLLDGTSAIPAFSSPIDPCAGTNPGTHASDSAILFNGAQLGFEVLNGQTSTSGNDLAFDNIRVLDATPTLSKEFAAGAQAGQPDTLTFTITNTSELAAKNGWSFTDTLPAGMTVSADPNVSSTCGSPSVTADAGAGAMSVTGSLAAGQDACTVSVDVTAAGGDYSNGADNITSLSGLNPPATPATVHYNLPPTATVNGPADGATYFQGQPVTADYSCSDPDGTVASCVGDQPDGSAIDTSTPGDGSFTVTATDNEGATSTTVTHYRVVPVVSVCRGTALSLLGLSIASANPATAPCATANKQVLHEQLIITPGIPLLHIPANQVTVNALMGSSTSGTGSAAGHAQIANVSVELPLVGISLQITGLTSDASSTLTSCSAPATLTGFSSIESITLNGKAISPAALTGFPVTIPLVVGTLAINEHAVSGNTITQTAVHLNVAGLIDLAIGQAVAGASCS